MLNLLSDVAIYEKQPVLNKNNQTYYRKKIIHNPSDNDIWFYCIESGKKHIAYNMLSAGFPIDRINEDGETFILLAFAHRKPRLIQLAIQFKANLYNTNRFNENSFFLSSQKHISTSIFKSIWTQANNLETLMYEKNSINQTLIDLLIVDSNFNKIKWLNENHPEFPKVKAELTEVSKKRNQSDIYYYLSGKEKLHRNLSSQLSLNKVCNNHCINKI